MAQEQRALRRVATLVARGASPSTVFRAVAGEVGRLFKADYASICRYEPEQMMCLVARWTAPGAADLGAPFGGRWPMGEDSSSAAVLRTGRPARRAVESITSEIGSWLRSREIGQVVSCPLTVDDRLWGVMVLEFLGSRPVPADTEDRANEFVQLAACTVAQAEGRAELIDSRTRLVMASDEARRRIERDLHDGTQQRLITLGLTLEAARARVPPQDEELSRSLSLAVEELSQVQAQLREIAHGLHPAILAKGGLGAAVKALTRRFPVATELDIDVDRRLPDPIEVTAYYVTAEALANVLKHASASRVRAELHMKNGSLHLAIRDDGVGGADPRRGSGLTGLKDRVEAVGGTMQITSPTGAGTSLFVEIPAGRRDGYTEPP
ncbi:GAF domain-containing sensor histidine kinase [Actinoallomurus sp. NBC_01490]|uniref:GAF domain-containing sensor histidine kinase n=1 Tax=Actinoallomurus sp. NBC_01490 TaxID=2903557 RepID=UPI002E377FB2|nr:GAF domain-containing sensor histidine kinase [Actinoallomurus sp. NBC_01490]